MGNNIFCHTNINLVFKMYLMLYRVNIESKLTSIKTFLLITKYSYIDNFLVLRTLIISFSYRYT